ncbi:MAG TPA: 50S ribosomal protein L25 [bacterium]|nr:50S ribosomal protein L25 [bacterium]
MAQIDMKVSTREEQRRGQLNDMRFQGIVPGIVYGHGKKPTMIKVNEREFRRLMHAAASENVIIKLEIEGVKDKKEASKTVILKEVQREPLAGSLIHIDFQEISLTEKIRIKVPVVALGEAIGVTQQGGVLEMVLRDLEVECLPTEIPDKIEVDITGLAIGKAIYVKDIPVTGHIRIINAPELTAIACSAPAAEIVASTAEEAGAAEPEVITEKKAEEGEEAAGEGEKKAEKKEEGAGKADKAEKKPEKQEKK